MPPSIGSAQFELSVNNAGFEASLNRAQAAARGTSDGISNSFKSAVSSITSVIARVNAAIGTAEVLAGVVLKVAALLDNGTTAAERFSTQIDKLGDADALKALDAKIAELQSNNLNNSFLNLLDETFGGGKTSAKYRNELANAEAQRDAIVRRRDALNARQAEADKRAAYARSASFQDEGALLDAQIADAIKYYDALAKGADFIKKIDEERLAIHKATLDVLNKEADAYVRLQQLQQQQIGAFGIGNLEGYLKTITSAVQSLPSRIR